MIDWVLYAFLGCQLLVVLFIAIHDWIPLGKLNNLAGIRTVDTKGRLLRVTVLSTLPFAVGLVASLYYAKSGFPMWLMTWLWISYGSGVYGIRPDTLHVCFHVVLLTLVGLLTVITFAGAKS